MINKYNPIYQVTDLISIRLPKWLSQISIQPMKLTKILKRVKGLIRCQVLVGVAILTKKDKIILIILIKIET